MNDPAGATSLRYITPHPMRLRPVPAAPRWRPLVRVTRRALELVFMLGLSILAATLSTHPAVAEEEERALDEVKERGWGFKTTAVALEAVTEGVWRTTGVSNAYIIDTTEGAIVVDTGALHQATEVMPLLESAVDGPVVKIILTHVHSDHTGGAKLWIEKYPEAEVITHEAFLKMQHELTILSEYYQRRNAIILPTLVAAAVEADASDSRIGFGGIVPDVVVDNDEPLILKVGKTEIHVLGLPAGEGADGLGVWLPQQRLLFTGDMTGPHFPMFPNLYSIRGERYREFLDYVDSLGLVLDLEPAIIAHGHFDVIRGEDYIAEALTRMRDAVEFVHDEVVAGMNAGKSLPELMATIELPPALALSEGYGKVSFSVRGLWETYTGWFAFESTTELYPVPVRSVYGDLVEAAGGGAKILAAAQVRFDGGEPEKALHLVEVAEASETPPVGLIPLKRKILQALRTRAVQETNNFMEVSWLDARIAELGPEDSPAPVAP